MITTNSYYMVNKGNKYMNLKEKKTHIFIEQLTSKQKSQLKGLAHSLKPVVQVGEEGLSAGVVAELNNALNKHELIKIQVATGLDATEKDTFTSELTAKLPEHAHFVSRIGRLVIIYLEKDPKDAKINLKKL